MSHARPNEEPDTETDWWIMAGWMRGRGRRRKVATDFEPWYERTEITELARLRELQQDTPDDAPLVRELRTALRGAYSQIGVLYDRHSADVERVRATEAKLRAAERHGWNG